MIRNKGLKLTSVCPENKSKMSKFPCAVLNVSKNFRIKSYLQM